MQKSSSQIFVHFLSEISINKIKTPEVVPISNLVEKEKKNPDMNAGEYYGDTYSLVSTYKEVSTSIEYYAETKTLSYRIPQINLYGGDIEANNQEILYKFMDDANRIKADDNEMIRFITVDYKVYGKNGVLSLVINGKEFGGTDSPGDRLINTIDISAGKRISNVCLLNSYGVDCPKVAVAFEKQVKKVV